LRFVTCAVVGIVLVAFGVVQAASDAFCASAAAPYALARHVPMPAALRVYRALDRIAPAEYVETTLASYELRRGDLRAATQYAVRLAPIAVRNELLGRIALRQGDRVLAREYFFAAPDFAALEREAQRIGRADPRQAYVFERSVRDRFAALQTHPDAVAEASWRMSGFAARAATRGADRRAWLRRSLRDAAAAVRLAPLNVTYLIAAAKAEVALGDKRAARRYDRRIRSVDPSAVVP
jgi:hypothetical protein